jgi:superfamily II DNA or RNA helicase
MIRIVPDIIGRCRFETDTPEVLEYLRSTFSYQKKIYSAFKTSENVESNPISPLFSFKTGLSIFFAQEFAKRNISVTFDPALKSVLIPPITPLSSDIIQPSNPKFKYYDYQERSIKALLKRGRGLFSSPTASGKSIMLYGCIINALEYNQKTLILVPRTQLVSQFYKDFLDYGFPKEDISMFCSLKGHTQCNTSSKIIVTNRQWLQLHSNELPNIKAIIVDEVHTLTPATQRFVNSLKTNYTLGVTATLSKEDLTRYYNIIGTFGPVIFSEEAQHLQEENYLSKIEVQPVKILHSKLAKGLLEEQNSGITDTSKLYYNEWNFLENNSSANNLIIQFVEQLKGNTIVLADHVAHIDYLYKILKKDKFKIYGQTPIEEREQIRTILDSFNGKEYIIIAANAAAGTGLNIKNIQNIVIASHGKGMIKVLQAIGRGLRKTKKDEEVLHLYDFSHNCLFSQKHFRQRLNLYKEKYGVVPKPTISLSAKTNMDLIDL